MAATEYYGVVQQIYVAYFGRPADPVGLSNFAAQLDAIGAPKTLAGVEQAYASNATIKALVDQFGTSSESATLYAGASTAAFVNAIYTNVLNRVADTEGLLYWASAIDRGVLTRGKAALSIMSGALSNTSAQGVIDAAVVTNKITVATNFTTGLNTTAEILSYAGDAAAQSARNLLLQVNNTTDTVAFQATVDSTIVSIGNILTPGTTYALTNSIDTIAGGSGNDTINAALTSAGADTFTSLDSINGGAGTDTLNLVSATGALTAAAGATVTGVEIANVTSAGAITAADVSGWTGLTTLNIASGGAISGINAAATTDINVANGIAGVTVNGGKNVTISNSTAGNISVGATTAAAGNVMATNSFATGTVGVKGAGALTASSVDGAMTFTNGTSINATATKAVSLADRTAHTASQTAANTANVAAGADSDATGLAKVAAAAKVTALTNLQTAIGLATNVSASQATALSIGAATTTALNAGAITLTDKVAIDAAFSGALATSTAAARTAAQAVLTPLQTAAATASTTAASADAANDASAAAALAAATAVVNADTANGALVDGSTVTATTNTALASATIKGNYGSTGLGTGAAFGNVVTDASALNNTLTTVTLENTGAAELTGKAIANVSATGMSSNVTVTNATAAHTETFTLSGVTGGTYTDANATTVNVVSNGSATNVLTGLSATLATKVNLTGTAGLTFGATTFAAAAVVDASGNSGTNSITIGAGQKYIGGSGADRVTTNGGALQTVTVDGGQGTADRLNLANAADFATTGAAKFLNFEILSLASGVSADVTAFTGSTFTSEILNGGVTSLTGLNAAQAAAITATASGTYTIGVTGAATVGQLDTVNMIVSDGSSTVNTLTLTTPVLAGIETLNLTATDNIVINALTGATALTNVNVTGAGTVSITSGVTALNVNSVIDASADNSAVVLNFAGGTGNGISLKAGNGNNTLTGTDIAGKGNSIVSGNGNSTVTGGQADDVITVGNGNNTIHGAAGANTITAGNGNNTIDTVGSAGVNTITAGNGINVITAGSGADKITVGTGYNLITGGAGGDTITFGTHATGVVDGIVMAAAGDTWTGAAIVSGTTALTGVDKISGLHAGDTIDISALSATYTGAAGTTIAAAATTTVSLVKGSFDSATSIWTTSATGTDTLVVYDADAAAGGLGLEAIVLVGTTATGTVASGILTLA